MEPLKSVITSGDTLSLHVEIWNVSREDIFICKDFQGPNLACGNLRLNFNHEAGPRSGVSYDYFRAHGVANKEAFASVLVREWISIPPKHFYGAIIEVDTNEYGMKGGRYQITGEYHSGGLLAEADSNNLLSYREEVARLPGKSWRGRVDTNSVQVRVLPKECRIKSSHDDEASCSSPCR